MVLQSEQYRGDRPLLLFKRSKPDVGIPRIHPVFSWAFCHARWILNGFHVQRGTGMTPYEFCTGTPYQGVLCEYGESLLCHVISANPNKRKCDAHWSKGVFLGKSDNDLYLTCALKDC